MKKLLSIAPSILYPLTLVIYGPPIYPRSVSFLCGLSLIKVWTLETNAKSVLSRWCWAQIGVFFVKWVMNLPSTYLSTILSPSSTWLSSPQLQILTFQNLWTRCCLLYRTSNKIAKRKFYGLIWLGPVFCAFGWSLTIKPSKILKSLLATFRKTSSISPLYGVLNLISFVIIIFLV